MTNKHWLDDFKHEFNELDVQETGWLKNNLHISLDTGLNVCGDDWPQDDESQFAELRHWLDENDVDFSEEDYVAGDQHHHSIDVSKQSIESYMRSRSQQK